MNEKREVFTSFLALDKFVFFSHETNFIAKLENVLETNVASTKNSVKRRLNFFFAQVYAAINCSLSCVPAGFSRCFFQL